MIAIIGGGVFGLSIGWYLARAGQPVTLFEKGRVGRGATGVAAGMLMPWKLSKSFSRNLFDLQQAGHKQWPAFAGALKRASDIDIHYQTEGRYFVALNKKTAKRFGKQYRFHQKIGFPLEWLTGDEARRREPGLGPQVQAAIFSPWGHQVDSRRLMRALKQAFLRAGGSLQEQTEVSQILVEDSQVQGLQLATGPVKANTVILAAGAWSNRLVPDALPQPVHPLKGQTLTLQMCAEAPLISTALIGPRYLVPRPDGRLIIGTTVEADTFDLRPTAGGVFSILKKAQQMVPGIKELPVLEISAGLRPTGPDRLPVLGPTGVGGLIMATGGHAYGILISPVVAQSLGQLLLTGRQPDMISQFNPPTHARPGRFPNLP